MSYNAADDFMNRRRNYAPPIYNDRHALEPPLPNLVVLNLEVDVVAENLIHEAIEHNRDRNIAVNFAENEQAADDVNGLAADENADSPNFDDFRENVENGMDNIRIVYVDAYGLAANGIIDDQNLDDVHMNSENRMEATELNASVNGIAAGDMINTSENSIELQEIKIELPVHEMAGNDYANLNKLLQDDPDPLDNDPAPVLLMLNQNCIIAVPGASSGNNEDDVIFERESDFPMPLADPITNLIKRENDLISGGIAYREEVCVLHFCFFVFIFCLSCKYSQLIILFLKADGFRRKKLFLVPTKVIQKLCLWNADAYRNVEIFDRKIVIVLLYVFKEHFTGTVVPKSVVKFIKGNYRKLRDSIR